MSAYGPGTDCVRSFEAKRSAVSASRRKAFEEATAALDVGTDPPPQHNQGPSATVMAWSTPPLERHSSFGNSTASGTVSKHFSARAAMSRACVRPHCEDSLTEEKLASTSFPNGRIAGTSAEQGQDRLPPQRRATTFTPRVGAAPGDSANAADSCTPGPIGVVGPSTYRSLHHPARRPPVTVAGRGGSRGNGEASDAAFRVPSIRTALRDTAGICDVSCCLSPVEQVLARRKRRRRANFGVSSALLLSSVSTEEVPLPPTLEQRPLVTGEDDEHNAAVPDLCSELESLDLSRISSESAGSWKSNAASGFQRKPIETVERGAAFHGAADVPQVLNADQTPSPRTGFEFDGSWNGDRDGFAASSPARNARREAIPLEESHGGMLTREGVDATSCGGVGCARGDERWPRARVRQSEVRPFEGSRGDNKDGDRDSCWKQVPATERLVKPNDSAGQDVPPSPLPSPPVPLSPTARRGTPTVRRLPPSRVLSASGSTLLQQCQQGDCAWGAPHSKHNSVCTERKSTLSSGREATMAVSRTAKNEASGEEGVDSRPEDPLFDIRDRRSIAAVTGYRGMDVEATGQAPQTGGSRSPQPRVGDRVGPPKTVKSLDPIAPTSDHARPISSPTRTPCDGREASQIFSSSAQTTITALHFGAEAGTQAKVLHRGENDGVDLAVLLSPPRATPHEASPRTGCNSLLQQAPPSKTIAVVILQRWLRRASLCRQSIAGLDGRAAQKTKEAYETENTKQLQSVKSSSSSTPPARHQTLEAHIEDVVHGHDGASIGRNNPVSQEEAVSLFFEAETRLRDAVSPYWEDDARHAGSHVFPQDGLLVHSADRESFANAPMPSSSTFDRNDDVSHDCSMKKPGSGAENSRDQTGSCDSKENDGTVQLPDFNGHEEEITVGTDQALTTRSSAVLFSVPSVSPLLAVRRGTSSTVVPRLKPDAHLQPSEQENRTDLHRNPTSGGRGCGSAKRVRECCAVPSFVSHQSLVARDMACYSVVALGSRRLAPGDVRFLTGAGYSLTVQEAYLRPSNGQSKGGREYSLGSPLFVDENDRKHPDVVVSTAVESPAVMKSGPLHHHQEDKPSMPLARAFARQGKMFYFEDVGSNPLLEAWGVGNPLLTRLPGKISGASKGGGAPYA